MTTTRDSFTKESGGEWMGCLTGSSEKTSADTNGSKMVDDEPGPQDRRNLRRGIVGPTGEPGAEVRNKSRFAGMNLGLHSRELLKSSPYRVPVKANEEVISNSCCLSAFDAQFGFMLQQHSRDSMGTQAILPRFPTCELQLCRIGKFYSVIKRFVW
jgi:hypothetical protein